MDQHIIDKWMPILAHINDSGTFAKIPESQLIQFCGIIDSCSQAIQALEYPDISIPGFSGKGDLDSALFLPIITKVLFLLAQNKPGVTLLGKYGFNNGSNPKKSVSIITDLVGKSSILQFESYLDQAIYDHLYIQLLALMEGCDYFIIHSILIESKINEDNKAAFTFTINYSTVNVYNELLKQYNMTNQTTPNFQECAQLNVEDMYSQSKGDTLGEIMNLQKDIQENVYGYDFTNLQHGKLKDLKSFIDWNEEAIRDEQREFANALGGIHTMSNALWKPWKSKHKEAGERSLKDLTPEELLELKYEWIDQLHFFINIGLSIGLNEKEVYNLYFAKNKHNRDRQATPGGY